MNKEFLKHLLRNGLIMQGDVERFVCGLSDEQCRQLLKSIIYVQPTRMIAYLESFIDGLEEGQ